MKKLLHIVTHDKFTQEYIMFMVNNFKEYEHIFFISINSASNDISVDKNLDFKVNIYRYSGRRWLAFSKEARRIINGADKIIISGIFGIERIIFYWPPYVFRKVYLQFWGGDFYQIRDIKYTVKNKRLWIYRQMLWYVLKMSHGVIFLINGEYEKFNQITKIKKKKVFVAPMPADNHFPFFKYRYNKGNKDKLPIRIVMGNSATLENQHFKTFEMLKKFKNEQIEILCPLSYGDSNYAEEVVMKGKEVFGEKFHPVLEWMSLEMYYEFLSTCDIGIFNNNRQQAMGNINAMLQMGKKVYIRSDTSMYNHYMNIGLKCYDVDDISKNSYDKLMEFPEKNYNEIISDKWFSKENDIVMWKNVFED